MTGRPWQTPGTPCPTSTCPWWGCCPPLCVACWWARSQVRTSCAAETRWNKASKPRAGPTCFPSLFVRWVQAREAQLWSVCDKERPDLLQAECKIRGKTFCLDVSARLQQVRSASVRDVWGWNVSLFSSADFTDEGENAATLWKRNRQPNVHRWRLGEQRHYHHQTIKPPERSPSPVVPVVLPMICFGFYIIVVVIIVIWNSLLVHDCCCITVKHGKKRTY